MHSTKSLAWSLRRQKKQFEKVGNHMDRDQAGTPKARSAQAILAVFVLSLIVYGFLQTNSRSPIVDSNGRNIINPSTRDRVKKIQIEERRQTETLWSDEYMAQHLGRSLERWWDRINASSPRLQALADIGKTTTVLMNHWKLHATIPHLNIEQFISTGNNLSYDSAAWKSFITSSMKDGWTLDHIEFRHIEFIPSSQGILRTSEFYFRAGISNTNTQHRCLLTGPLKVQWKNTDLPQGDINQIEQIDVSLLELVSARTGQPFKLIHEETIKPPENAESIDPLLVYDIDEDGISEIILANKNKLLRYHPEGHFTSSPLCTFHPGLISTAVLADLNGDGITDFICHKQEGLVVIPGAPNGLFDQYEIMLRPADSRTVYPMVLSVGDMDRDGDSDIFLGQYRVPYEGGALPTPFYDADDGYPFFLLRNLGNWEFEDVTDSALPNARRHRRIYSASLADLDGINGLDLIVVGDFAGADLYLNDGTGNFKVATNRFGDSHGFGMAHTFSDFNVDGKLDLLMIGMTSPTVDRLEFLNLRRSGLTEDHSLRRRVASGNRLFLSTQSMGFEQNELSLSIGRAGWAWGCSSADFDNNGYPDVIIGNGLETRQFVQDYESEYWLHDAFIADSEPDPAAYLYFKEKFAQTRGKGQSYGGYESNRLFLNLEGKSFLDVGHLWGLGLQRDTRNVVTDDFNGDGLVDCLFTHYEAWPDQSQVLRVYQNELQTPSNWIGFRLASEPNQASPVGVTIEIETENLRQVKTIVTGDSYRSQHARSVHFGMGSDSLILSAIVTWPNGRQTNIRKPQINRYHRISWLSQSLLNDKE